MSDKILKKDFCVSHSFKTKGEITERSVLVADAFGLGIDEKHDFCIYDNFKFDLCSNDIVYITGASGSGKSWLLKNIFSKFKNSLSIDDIKIDDNEILIEGVGKDLNDAIKKLNLAGLGDAFLYLRKYNQLSDGQKYRYAIAKFIDLDAKVWILDEFGAKLDRTTAKIVAYNLQKIARQLNKCVVCATTHEDLIDSLKPSLIIKKGFEDEVESYRKTLDDYPKRIKEIYTDIRVEKGDKEDYKKLSKFHYRQSRLGAVKNYYRLLHKDTVIGVMAITYPHLALKGRNIYTNKKYAKMTKEICTEINKQFECISRVILHPQYRGIGLAHYFLREYFKLSDCPYIETVAVMSKYSPFFAKAGMTHVETVQDKKRSLLVKQLEAYNFNTDLISSSTYNETVYNKLDETQQTEVKIIIKNILNKYKGAVSKLFSKKKSIDEIVNESLFTIMKEIKRADTWYWILENKKEK